MIKIIIISIILSCPVVAFATPAEGLITWESYHYLTGIAGISVALLFWFAIFKAML